MSLMEGSEDTFLELREKFVPTFMRSCIFWLLCAAAAWFPAHNCPDCD